MRSTSQSPSASTALKLVESLQNRFVQRLKAVAANHGEPADFESVEWLRDAGRHGGGVRFEAPTGTVFNRGSVNISQVHYDDIPEKSLASATALSTIIHPNSPHAPSVHIHISWTELKSEAGYWRIMADLNPSIIPCQYQGKFKQTLVDLSGPLASRGLAQGDKYFNIETLNRHRGVSHFYLEAYNSDEPLKDFELARTFGEGIIDCYSEILESCLAQETPVSATDRQQQLAYHTLYFYQVLTLDRGTTSGLMIHNQNDVGTLGSLPSHVDKKLLQEWIIKTPHPQSELLETLISCLPNETSCLVDNNVKERLAAVIREHYQKYPEALAMQARGDIIPPTVQNHS